MTLDELIQKLTELRAEFGGGHHEVRMRILDLRQVPAPVTGVFLNAEHDEHKNVTEEWIELDDDESEVVATGRRLATQSAP